MELPNCPGCGAKSVRDDSITNGVEGAVRCAECSFCALITDWKQSDQSKRIDELEKLLNEFSVCNECGKLIVGKPVCSKCIRCDDDGCTSD